MLDTTFALGSEIMGGMDWVYLGVGLVLGWGVSRFASPKPLAGQAEEEPKIPTLKVEPQLPVESTQLQEDGKEEPDAPILKAEPQLPVESAQLQEDLKQMQMAYHLASEMSQFKAGFLARTSHELRSPLSSMIGLQQLILSDLCEDVAEEREFVTQANASALKLVKLLDELIDVSKAEHGTSRLDTQPLSLAEVLGEVYSLTHLIAENRSLRLQVLPSDEIYVMADLRRLRQVLVSLVSGAIAKMSSGSIQISATQTSDLACIEIDAECPVEAWSEPIDLLQSPPEQSISTTDRPSVGLNLLVAQSLLEVMQGRLEVVPSEGGTRFQCSIPLASAEMRQRSLVLD